MCYCAAQAELHYLSLKKIKTFDTYLMLRQGHLHIPYARLISSVTTVRSDKWQSLLHRGLISPNMWQTSSLTHKQPLRLFTGLTLSLPRVPTAQYECVSVTPEFLMET